MLQGIRPSAPTMPSFGHSVSFAGANKMESYGNFDSWNWVSQQANTPPINFPIVFGQSLYSNLPLPQQQPDAGLQSRHHSIATSHVIPPPTSTPPPPRQPIGGTLVKAQPAFKPTWHGYLDTTKDAMTIVEAALQGRLSHISRRPHDKERAEMLTSGTVLVYEENASGIKRWTDAVHWSPSRVMNNCLIYRQLVRALKPEEKKTSLNPSCGTKRKRREGAFPSTTKTGDNLNNSEDEYETSTYESALAGGATPDGALGKIYANFAQNLTPDQQRRYCGSLVDSYEFKEGGLMKKTISVKYQGAHHHVISYYSLEDVVSGKLQRPYQDPETSDIQPRPELLSGWKVSLEDEETKEMPVPLAAQYPAQVEPSRSQHSVVGRVTQAFPTHGLPQAHGTVRLQVPDYWQSAQVHNFASSPQRHQQYPPAQHPTSHYPTGPTTQYPTQQSSSQHLSAQASSGEHYKQSPPSQQYIQQPPSEHYAQQPPSQHYSSQAMPVQDFASRSIQPYTVGQLAPSHQYPQQPPNASYTVPRSGHIGHPPQYAVPQAAVFNPQLSSQASTRVQHLSPSPIQQHDPSRRASAPIAMQTYDQPQYQVVPHSQAYYIPDQKYSTTPGYGY
ncbi:Gti1/Pac2 family-domain-containing protein [Massariosphaeria phaeospora]|uniref:Gti1/Pac2 family-domain-containing protein n=1 Tax=Massariosphaeria phaeospora TaxID=100035 RepID=A0A7C8M3B2_9PLEO|nr:Gti1/Pac2 family-domain-containing protein [Massariosphaeria phaeospora]